MEPVAIGDLRSEYYDVNSDFPGLWELDENRREDVDFRNSSSIRIWYNDLTSNFATHWHNALEIIIPLTIIMTLKWKVSLTILDLMKS